MTPPASQQGIEQTGTWGCDARREYTVIGDAVNLASRIEGLTKVHGVPVLCTAQVRQQVGDAVAWQALPPAAVRGRAELVATWAPTTSRQLR